MDEQVIGLVLEKHAETFNVDVGGPFTAALSVLAFEVSPGQPKGSREGLEEVSKLRTVYSDAGSGDQSYWQLTLPHVETPNNL